jgi:hypothetical protein
MELSLVLIQLHSSLSFNKFFSTHQNHFSHSFVSSAVGFNVAVLSGGFLYPLGNRILSFLVLILSLVNLFVVMFLFEESKSQHTSKTVEVRPRNRIQMLKILWKSDLQLLILFHMAIVIFSNM